MHSPRKSDKLIVQEDGLENGHDGMPQEIWDDLIKNENYIYYKLMFLNGSVLWAYYSCLSAQDFYAAQFPNSGLNFTFLTTLVTSWPMVFGQSVQMIFGLDKKISQATRVYGGYAIFVTMAILIMVFSAINFSNEKTGGVLVLICFGCIGFGNSLSEATYYTLAALFPVPKFSNAVQIGNAWAGIINITVSTIIRLAVGGVHQTDDSTSTSFYLFFSLLVVVLLVALFVYRGLINTPCVKFLLERNEESTRAEKLDTQSIPETLSNLGRIFSIIWVPAIAQFLIFFVSLSVFPGFGCAANAGDGVTAYWYCAPGIIGSYNYGDFFGRLLCTAAVYKIFNMKLSFFLSVLRIAYIPLLLMGVAGTSFYVFPEDSLSPLPYNIVLNLTIGLTNGLLSTVTMGFAPRMLNPVDRESGGAIMVLFLFLGIATGATFGFLVKDNHWLGL